jgi:hypothetical protein
MNKSGLIHKIAKEIDISKRLEEDALEKIKIVHKMLIEHVNHFLTKVHGHLFGTLTTELEILYKDIRALKDILPRSYGKRIDELEISLQEFIDEYSRNNPPFTEAAGKINADERLNSFIAAFIPRFKATIFKGLAVEQRKIEESLSSLKKEQVYEPVH